MSQKLNNTSNASDKFSGCYFVLPDRTQFSAALIIAADITVYIEMS